MLINKIKRKKFNVGIIGLGYVGLPRSFNFVKIKLEFTELIAT